MYQRAKQQRKASGITHERCANFRHRKKNQKRANLKLRHVLRAGDLKSQRTVYESYMQFFMQHKI